MNTGSLPVHAFVNLSDFLELTHEEFERMLPDLAMWFVHAKLCTEQGAAVQNFKWVDDGKPGMLHHIKIHDPQNGDVHTIYGPAADKPR